MQHRVSNVILAAGAWLAVSAGAHAAWAADAQSSAGAEISEPPPEAPAASGSALLTAQSFLAEDKIVPGVALGLRARRFQLDLETSLLWLADSSAAQGKSLLGSGFGAHVMYLPVHRRSFDVGLGLGSDAYWLWNVHGDAAEVALAVKAAANVWLAPSLGLYGSARAYPWHSSGLELGTRRDGGGGLPVLFTLGITWQL